MQNYSPQTKSFLILLCLAILGTCLALILWPNLSSFSYISYRYAKTDKAADSVSGAPAAEAQQPVIPSVDTTDWKTYANSEYGFSFKYKPDWQVKAMTTKNDFKILEIDPGKKYYNIKIYISPKEFYVMDGLPTKTETIGGKEAINVNNLLYGIKTDKYYYTFDVGLSLSLTADFDALVHSVQFQ